MGNHIKPAYFTICARNYMAYALTLRDSLRRIDSDADFFVFLADDAISEPGFSDFAIPVRALNIEQESEMGFRYTLMEFSTAIKPFCFQYIFDSMGYDAAIYLDPDIQIFAPLERVEKAIRDGASCVLTPHILEPLTDEFIPGDRHILQSGTFNLGFAAFANQSESRSFLNWWSKQLQTHCLDDLANGLFVDQKFVEFAPCFLSNLMILRDPGYNVAYWNLSHRPISQNNGTWLAGDVPLVFFHFSGLISKDPTVFSKHQNRFKPDTAGLAAQLLKEYTGLLINNNHETWQQQAYVYDRFADGTLIPPVMRSDQYLDRPTQTNFDNPNWNAWNDPCLEVVQDRGIKITRFMYAVFLSRPDLQAAFPLTVRTGRKGFHNWFIHNGPSECRAPVRVVNAALEDETLPMFLARRIKTFLMKFFRR